MKIWTWGEVKAKVKRDMYLEDEDFITDIELLGYGQSAVDEAEQEFMKIYSKYFETETTLNLVSGTNGYDLPSDIYATKILFVQYESGDRKYPLRRIRNLDEIAYVHEGDDFRYRIVNLNNQDGPRMFLYPTPQADEFNTVKIYYLRNALELVDDDSVVDMPEAAQFIIQHIKDACSNKEMGPMYQAPESEKLARQRRLMIEALSEMYPDADNKIEPDLSFYYDFDHRHHEFGEF